MKIIIAAFALAIASPAVAQTAPTGTAADHARHQHGNHQPHQPGQHQQGQHQGMAHGQSGQEGRGASSSCCADRNGNGRMDCCEGMAQAGESRPNSGVQPQVQQNH